MMSKAVQLYSAAIVNSGSPGIVKGGGSLL